MDTKYIFFWGELPPKTVHGASISSKINLDILSQRFEVSIVEEYSALKYHGKFSLLKVKDFFKSIFFVWIALSKKIGRFNIYYGVIYLSTLGIIKNLLVASAFKVLNRNSKLILHYHRSDFSSFIGKRTNKFLYRLLDFFVDEYMVLSKKQHSEIVNYTSKTVHVVYNTIEEDSIVEVTFDRNNNALNLLFLSNYIIEKGFLDVIDAQKKLNYLIPGGFILNCHGSMTNSLEQELNIVMDDLLLHNVNIRERVYGVEKSEALGRSDVIILPSYNEGLPLILLEALRLGKPIIISKVGYISEVLGESYPLYCEPKNVDSIVECVLKFRDHYNNLDFSNSLKDLYQNFSHKQHTQNIYSIFER